MGQVVINEYSASNIGTVTDNYNEYEDWVELYNSSASAIDLTGYYLSDKAGNTVKWQFTSGTIAASGHLLIWCSGRDEIAGGNFHTNFKLTQTKPEKIILSAPSGTVLDSLTMNPAQGDHARGRTTDGAAAWSVFTTPTPGTSNSNPMQEYATVPQFSLAPGFYTGSQNLDITSPDANITIRYTTDGSTPTTASTIVSGQITVSNTQVIRARAFSSIPDIPASFIETNTYIIDKTHTIPVLSIAGDQVLNLLNGGFISPDGTFEYFDRSGQMVSEGTGEMNKHGNDSWAYDQRGIDYVCRDQYGYNHAVTYKLFDNKSRDEFQRIIIKAAANDNYPFEDGAHIRDAYVHMLSQYGKLKMDERTYEPCIMYVNGQYWGVYEIREKVDDHDFTEYYYNQGRNDIDFLKTWGPTWAEYGTRTDWDALYNYIMTNDMAVAANYQYVTDLYNVGSLVDYTVLNSYVVCADWLNWNTAWWRGRNPNGDKKKWRYVLWDMDATFGHYINYTGIPTQAPTADPCDPETLGGTSDPEGHMTLLVKLMDNPDFKQYYISRYIDLSNTIFQCSYMQSLLDSMISLIEPEMQDQVNRWGGTYAGWQANVQSLKDYIDDRCAAFAQGMTGCYNLTGPYDIMVDAQPPGAGTVKVNSLDISQFTWTGSFFGGIDILLDANAATGWEFDHWELNNHVVTPGDTAEQATLNITSTDTIVAHFVPEGQNPPPPPPPPPPVDTTGEEIVIQPHSDLFVPTAFSPNGDGFNDLYLVHGNDIATFHLIIYNRWGEVVFESKDQLKGWDGTYKDKLLNSGVFAYQLKILYTDDKVEIKAGNITLMR